MQGVRTRGDMEGGGGGTCWVRGGGGANNIAGLVLLTCSPVIGLDDSVEVRQRKGLGSGLIQHTRHTSYREGKQVKSC